MASPAMYRTDMGSQYGSYIDLHNFLELSQRNGEDWSEFKSIVGSSHALCGVLDQVRTVAPTDSTILIEGETGTGKELIARAIHARSDRRNRPLVKLNCAASLVVNAPAKFRVESEI